MSNAEKLDSMIQASYSTNVRELAMLWDKMGLSQDEVDQRMTTVKLRISDITTEMVECDRDNKMKIEEACDNLKKDIRVMWRKLKKQGEPECLPDGMTLLEQQKQLKMCLLSLEDKRNEMMGEFRSLVQDERALAAKLGLEAVMIDEDTIPEKEDIMRVEENLRKCVRVKEERETHMFTMKEQVVALMDTLGMDMNATMLSSVLDGDEEFDSLKLSDLRSIQHTMDELAKSLEEKKVEVRELLTDINSLYSRLDIPASERCPLCMGQVCGEEELIKEGNFSQLKEEKAKLEKCKMANMKIIVENAKAELSELWDAGMAGEEERALFLGSLDDDADKALVRIETEITRVEKYIAQHKDTFHKLSVFVALCDLAQDLKVRMKDPNRLFKNRGKALMKEEQDRKKVNSIPHRKEELLALAEHRGNLLVYDCLLSAYVEEHAQGYEELFPPATRPEKSKSNSSLSAGRNGLSFSTTTRSNKTASPRSTKKLGRFYKSPVARQGRKTPQSLHQSVRADRVPGSSPLARPSQRMTRSNTTLGMAKTRSNTTLGTAKTRSTKVQLSSLLHDGTINESVFTDNVPHSSTVCMPELCKVQDMSMEADSTVLLNGLITKLVAARDAEILQDRTLEQNCVAGVAGKGRRKLRRSNSCSEMVVARRQGSTEHRENLSSIRERNTVMRSSTTLTGSGTRASKAVSRGLVRAGSSSNLMLR